MQELNLQVPYLLNMILEIISKEVKENGFTDEDYCLYAHKKTITPELICYLDLYPTVSDDDKDIYPDFIIKENLSLLYYGEQFEDVLLNVLDQKDNPAIEDYISALDYYSKNDTFKEL